MVMPSRPGARATMEEDEMTSLLRRLGIIEPDTSSGQGTWRSDWRGGREGGDWRGDWRSREATMASAVPPMLAEPEAAGYKGGGFSTQLWEGFMGAVSAPAALIPGIDRRETPDPITGGEVAGNIVGQFLGWAGLSVLAAATLGKGALAVSGIAGATAKTGVAAQVVKYGVAEGALGALYARNEEMSPGEIAKHAGYGAALGIASPIIGAATRGIRADAVNKLRKIRGRHIDSTFRGTPEVGVPRPGRTPREEHVAYGLFGRETQAQHALSLPDDIGIRRGLAPGELSSKRIADEVRDRAIRAGKYDKLTEATMSAFDAPSGGWSVGDSGSFAKVWEALPEQQMGKMFEKLPPQKQMSVAVRALWDDEGARSILKPILRQTEDSAWKSRKMMVGLAHGSPIDAVHQRTVRTALGQAEGVKDKAVFDRVIGMKTGPDSVIPDDIVGRSLRDQIDFLDESIKFDLKSRAQFLEARNAWSGKDLSTAADIKQYSDNVGRVEELLKARYRLLPDVEQVFGEYRHGTIRGLYAAAEKRGAEKARGQFATEGKLYIDPDLRNILKREGVTSPQQLSLEKRRNFFARKNSLEMQGRQTEMDIWHLNPEEVFPGKTADYASTDMLALAPVKEPNSFDDLLKVTHPNHIDRYLQPMRGVMGEADFREVRAAGGAARKVGGTWEKRVEDVYKPLKTSLLDSSGTKRWKETADEAVTRWLKTPRKDRARFVENARKRTVDGNVLWTDEVDKIAKETDQMFSQLGDLFGIPKERLIKNFAPRRHPDGTSYMANVGQDPNFDFMSHEMRTGFMWPQEMSSYRLMKSYLRGGIKEKYYKPTFKNLDKKWDPQNFQKTAQMDKAGFLDRHGLQGLSGKKLEAALRKLPKKDKDTYLRLTEEVKEAADLVKNLSAMNIDKHRQQLYRGFRNNVLGQPGPMEDVLDRSIGTVANALFGMDPQKRYTKEILSFITDMMYGSTISYNAFTPIKNLTQQLLPVMHLDDDPIVGLRYWARAQMQGPGTELGQLSDSTNWVMDSRIATEALARQDAGLRKLSPPLGKALDKGYGFFKWADKKNVRTSHLMKLMYELDKGAPLERAIEEAYTFTMATQFMYGLDSPMLYKGELGRGLGVLMSWPLNYANLLRQQAFNEGAWAKAAGMFTGGAMLADGLSETGISFESVNPVQTASGVLPVSLLEGSDRWPIVLRAGAATFNYGRALFDGDPIATDNARRNFGRAAWTFVPAGTQARRALDGIDTLINDGKKYDQQDRFLHEVEGREKITQFIGPTTEGVKRWRHLQVVAEQSSSYNRLRRQAYDALYDGDYEEFARKQDQLVLFYGKGIEGHEAQRQMELSQQSSLERAAMGLPKEMRDATLRKIQGAQQEPQTVRPW